LIVVFGSLSAVAAIPHGRISILKARYCRTERDMTESQVRSIMGSLATPHEMKGGILYWDRDLDEHSRKIILENGVATIYPKPSPRVEKTLIYRVNALPFHTYFQFMFDADDRLIGRHLHDYD